ncbi:Armadillo repeat protein deleted in velo-cardio-facial syndrome [Liparis tanakae]|uniref:Armadillo repeat protein deleted in velo-cardio-facial syndrome n=1 Tax=Liparis tanakae TaxID=230148 RepID=A0A4Z2IF27_9TELE|nr:Armadillo repeat protein deleted in velo-cardio-facial syndrome [Liparis tanakae]
MLLAISAAVLMHHSVQLVARQPAVDPGSFWSHFPSDRSSCSPLLPVVVLSLVSRLLGYNEKDCLPAGLSSSLKEGRTCLSQCDIFGHQVQHDLTSQLPETSRLCEADCTSVWGTRVLRSRTTLLCPGGGPGIRRRLSVENQPGAPAPFVKSSEAFDSRRGRRSDPRGEPRRCRIKSSAVFVETDERQGFCQAAVPSKAAQPLELGVYGRLIHPMISPSGLNLSVLLAVSSFCFCYSGGCLFSNAAQPAYLLDLYNCVSTLDMEDYDGHSAASILASVKEQEARFEQLTRALEEERRTVTLQLERSNMPPNPPTSQPLAWQQVGMQVGCENLPITGQCLGDIRVLARAQDNAARFCRNRKWHSAPLPVFG